MGQPPKLGSRTASSRPALPLAAGLALLGSAPPPENADEQRAEAGTARAELRVQLGKAEPPRCSRELSGESNLPAVDAFFGAAGAKAAPAAPR